MKRQELHFKHGRWDSSDQPPFLRETMQHILSKSGRRKEHREVNPAFGAAFPPDVSTETEADTKRLEVDHRFQKTHGTRRRKSTF